MLCKLADFTYWLIYYYGNWRTSYYIICSTLLLHRAGWRAEPSQDIIIYRWLQFTGSPKMNQGLLIGFVWTQIKKMIPAFNCNLSSMMLSPELSLEQQWMKVLVVWWWDWGGLGSHPGSSVGKSSWHLFWLPEGSSSYEGHSEAWKMSSVKDTASFCKASITNPLEGNLTCCAATRDI